MAGELGLDIDNMRPRLAARVCGMRDGIPCLWMCGGTSMGAIFLARDLPADPAVRDALLLPIMGSPDPAQTDGLGGANLLTSKVAVPSPPSRPDADVDCLFLQVFVDRALVSDAQGCGNILAAVGPAAIERGLGRRERGPHPHGQHRRDRSGHPADPDAAA